MRSFGLLLHISSLPSAWGIGDLGPEAHAFAASIAEAGASVWQFLPLNPTSTFIGNSPYSSPSAFAGNPLFISPEYMVRDGFLSNMDLDDSFLCIPGGSVAPEATRVSFEKVSAHREHLFEVAYAKCRERLPHMDDFTAFCREHDPVWLHDYARFASLKEAHEQKAWVEWPKAYRLRAPEALAEWDRAACDAILKVKFIQFLFYSQWAALRETCTKHGIRLLGDVPIYVTHDSADVWANPEYFNLDETMQPITVSGVPPDYFSETGQRWGNPVFRWDVMARDGFSWWKKRLGHGLQLADMVRLDHFRGFCGFWEIPAEEETAVNGAWKHAPGVELFTALHEHFGSLPFLAEDLGIITDDVRELMRRFGLPGMHVLQFAFGGCEPAGNPDIPHRHHTCSYVYTGTHDNTTTRSWFEDACAQEKENFMRYIGREIAPDRAGRAMARLAFASVAECAILPMQDALFLGWEGRMNTPGLAVGNWGWRMTREEAEPSRIAWLREFAALYGRLVPSC